MILKITSIAAKSTALAGTLEKGIKVKKFACGDVVPGCPETFVGADDDEILAQVAAHAAAAHNITEVDSGLVARVRLAITAA